MQQATEQFRSQSTIPTRAAIYARVSSDQQVERQTIGSQIGDLLARAAADGYEVGEEFRFLDDGHSGASLIRPALERLRDLVAISAIDLVYVHAPDRLARSYAHQAVLVEEFARAGAQIVFLNRPIGHSPEDNLLLQLQGMFAEYERARMLERSRRGKRRRECPLEPEHDLDTAVEPRLCRPGHLWKECFGPMAATSAPRTRSRPHAETTVPPGQSTARALDHDPCPGPC